MYVWRDKTGRIESVTGSIHQPTLDWLLAEDKWREEQSGGKRATSAARPSHPAKQSAKQPTKEPAKQEPQAPANDEPKTTRRE